jgi:chemotaxis protein MotA
LIAFSDKARREGLLALEEDLEDLDDEFLKKGMRLVVDGVDGGIIRDMLELDLSEMQARHATNLTAVTMFASLAPAYGMKGTVIGLVAMLRNLEDRSALGPNMAVALITTLYGAMVANIFAIPIVGKLKTFDAEESKLKEMEIEGILSIQAGENSRTLATKLLCYVGPKVRAAIEADIMK